jgi:hypothetical protein
VRYDHGGSSATSFRSTPGTRRVRRAAAFVVAVACTVAVLGFASPARSAELRAALVVGDSVTVGATPAIQSAAFGQGWSVSIDAQIGRTTEQGAQILASMRGHFPPVVIIELGNNDAENSQQFAVSIDAVMRELAGVRHVVWYTMSSFASWVPAANAELRAASERWANLVLADWATASEASPDLLSGSGPHLLEAGGTAFADLLFNVIDHFRAPAPVVVALHAPARPVKPSYASAPTPPPASIIGMNATPWASGSSLVAPDGGVFAFGDARFCGVGDAPALGDPMAGVDAPRRGIT